MERYTEDFLKHAYVKCAKCGKELKYGLNLPRNCEFFHMGEDGKLRMNLEENEPYCCDCIIELQGGNNEGSS